MDAYIEFFLNSRSSVVQLETIELSHPRFTTTHRLVRNATNGLVLMDGTTEVNFIYVPMRITPMSQRDNLDQIIKIDMGDLGEILPIELDRMYGKNGFSTKPKMIYKVYRDDMLLYNLPIHGPIELEIKTFSFTKQGASFEAKAPSLNVNKVGEFYSLSTFPMLKGTI